MSERCDSLLCAEEYKLEALLVSRIAYISSSNKWGKLDL
jgi:hypothetical protein